MSQGETVLIKSIPDAICWKMATQLDTPEKPNWKTLINKINQSKKIYTEKAILRFHMAILNPNGSPTLELLTDLGRKKKTRDQLIGWMKQLGKFHELVKYLELGEEALKEINPSITRQPQSAICQIGSDLKLLVEANGSAPLKYQWFKGSYELPAQTSNTFSLESVSAQDEGYYTCRVNNDFGFVYSNWSKVDVIASPAPAIVSDVLNVPLITMHPRSVTIRINGDLHLNGDAVGFPLPVLQWFYNDKPLLGQCSRELVIPNIQSDQEGFYKLRASNKHQFTDSIAAQVTVVKTVPEDSLHSGERYQTSTTTKNKDKYVLDVETIPSDSFSTFGNAIGGRGGDHIPGSGISLRSPSIVSEKVALVIGNEKYIHEKDLGRLVHPVNDAHDISAKLRSLDFKVVSLINLNLNDMKCAVKFFCDLIDRGTYGLFYFAGHGFEISGESYLMPLDATASYRPEENLALSDVLFPMTRKRPKLSVVFVDSCRTQPEHCRENPLLMTWQQAAGLDLQRTNVTIAYGCCSKGRVLESPMMRNGYFAHYLLENIEENVKIDDVMFEVSKGIHQENIVDPATGRTQVVYRHSTVVDDLKLTDKPISSESTDQAILWRQAHVAPKSPVTILQNDFVTVNLVLTAEFSNCLIIQSEIRKRPTCSFCNVVFILPQKIGGATVETISPEQGNEKNINIENKFVRISNLERLEGDINIHLEVLYEAGGTQKQQRAFYSIKEIPLYAKIAAQLNKMKIF